MGASAWSFFLGLFGWLVTSLRAHMAHVGAVILLAFGWFVTNFAAKPYVDFRNLKREVHQELIFTANVGPMSLGTPDYSNAVDSLRRLGSRVRVHPLRWCLSVCGYDLAQAGNALIALSNSLSAYDDARMRHKKSILDGLRLPLDLL
jgi:hypothetical protein